MERSVLPRVADPCFADESPDDDEHTREGHPELDRTGTSFGAPHKPLKDAATSSRP